MKQAGTFLNKHKKLKYLKQQVYILASNCCQDSYKHVWNITCLALSLNNYQSVMRRDDLRKTDQTKRKGVGSEHLEDRV